MFTALSQVKETIEANINDFRYRRGKALDRDSLNDKKPENSKINKRVLKNFEKRLLE